MAEEFEDRDLSGAVFKPMVFEAGLLHVEPGTIGDAKLQW